MWSFLVLWGNKNYSEDFMKKWYYSAAKDQLSVHYKSQGMKWLHGIGPSWGWILRKRRFNPQLEELFRISSLVRL